MTDPEPQRTTRQTYLMIFTGAAAAGWGVMQLSRSPYLTDENVSGSGAGQPQPDPSPAAGMARPIR